MTPTPPADQTATSGPTPVCPQCQGQGVRVFLGALGTERATCKYCNGTGKFTPPPAAPKTATTRTDAAMSIWRTHHELTTVSCDRAFDYEGWDFARTLERELAEARKEWNGWKMAAQLTGVYRSDTDVSTFDKYRVAQGAAVTGLLCNIEDLKADLATAQSRIAELERESSELIQMMRNAVADGMGHTSIRAFLSRLDAAMTKEGAACRHCLKTECECSDADVSADMGDK